MINPELRGLRQQAQAAGEQKTTLSSTHCCPAPYTEARLVPQVPWVQGLQGSPRSLVGQGSHPTDMAPWEGSQWWDRWRSCWHRRGLPPALQPACFPRQPGNPPLPLFLGLEL